MRYGLISIAAAVGATLAFTGAHPQAPSAQTTATQNPPSTQVQTVPAQCPPGVTGPCWKLQYSRGGKQSRVPGESYIAHSPPPAYAIPSCTKDSDCSGNARCRGGICGRSKMGCESDSDCKYSEYCDTSRPLHPPEDPGTCAPRGGRY